MNFLLISLFTSILLFNTGYCKTAEEWKSRSVYQILTDRFAKTDGDTQPCPDFNNYCGGTFKGILSNLDYIQGMGFDAIWISPVTANTPGGYHGYWTSNLYEINEYFGTAEELKELIDACHERDIWVMVDVVANHVGYVEWIEGVPTYTQVVPFNDPSHYHPYSQCELIDWKDQSSVENCWLNGLPDLDQNHPFVRETFLNWARDFVEMYNIDALRIDTVAHVSRDFWSEFSRAAGVYTIGEILSYDLPYLASYQGPLDGVLNYALYSTLRYTFQQGGSMNSIQAYYDGARSTWADISLLGNFVDNHDNPRFLSGSGDHQAFKSALAFSICSEGIPMVYYGDEQMYGGGMDPANREPLWTSMNTESEIYEFLKKLNGLRKSSEFYKHEQIQRYSDDQFYAFTRGDILFAFTNTHDYQSKMISYHPYAEGTQLCNIFHREDCIEVRNGEFPVVLINGEVKVFTPVRTETEEPEAVSSAWLGIKAALSSSSMFGTSSMSQLRF